MRWIERMWSQAHVMISLRRSLVRDAGKAAPGEPPAARLPPEPLALLALSPLEGCASAGFGVGVAALSMRMF